MAYGNWDDIFETFRRVLDNKRYGELAEHMLQLTTGLRPQLASLEAQGVVPVTTLLMFCLWFPGSSFKIGTLWTEGELFMVRLSNGDDTDEEVIVPMEEVAQTMQSFAQKILSRD